MRVDQSGHNIHAVSIDGLVHIPGLKVGPNGRDPAILDQDILPDTRGVVPLQGQQNTILDHGLGHGNLRVLASERAGAALQQCRCQPWDEDEGKCDEGHHDDEGCGSQENLAQVGKAFGQGRLDHIDA